MARHGRIGFLALVLAGALIGTRPAVGEAARPDEGERPLVFGVNRVGDAALLYSPPDYIEHMYRRVAEAGGTCVRLTASPQDIEAVRGQRDWREFDRDLELALKYGQEPMALIVNTPAWASPTGEATHLYPYKTELLPEFGDYCTELARRTRGKVRYFQLWNEQNGCSWHFHDGFNHADEYLPVLKVCYDALKKGNPDCDLSLGSLDDAQGYARIFMTKTYEEKKKQAVQDPIFDAVSSHPYSVYPAIMRAKLDVVGSIMAAHGDGSKPLWITEYGWHTGHMALEEQAAHVAKFLKAFAQPAWDDLQVAIYLSIADYEGRTTGFGLTDANLRPRPAFYAFQGAERFGAFPPYQIEPTWTADDELAIAWRTLEPTTGSVTLSASGQRGEPATRTTSLGKEHRVVFGDLTAERYDFRISTTRDTIGSMKRARSAEYSALRPQRGIMNGGFESGFFAGIAAGWEIEGEGFSTDAALMPRTQIGHGQHAQAVFVRGDKEHERIASTLSTVVAATPGRPIRIAFSWMGRTAKPTVKVLARAGIHPQGDSDAGDDRIEYAEWRELKPFWDDGPTAVSAVAGNSVVRLFIQCRTEGELGKGLAAFVLDDVHVVSQAGGSE